VLAPRRAIAAVEAFAGTDLPVPPELPYYAAPEAVTTERLADVGLGLLVMAGIYLLGRVIRLGAPRFRPFVLTASVTGLLMLTVVDPLFWEYGGVEVDEGGFAVRLWTTGRERVQWSELRAVEVEGGHAWPAFSDDTTLVLVPYEGERIRFPRFAPGAVEVAAAVRDRLEKLKQ
jgi:hypothetical protein